MLKTTLIALLALAALASGQKANFANYKVFRITPKNENELEQLRRFESFDDSVEFWREPSSVNQPADLMVGPEHQADVARLLASSRLDHIVYVNDVQRLIDDEKRSNEQYDAQIGDYDFKSYKKIEHVNAWLATLAERYPERVELIVAGRTYEGRNITGVKISHGADRPAVFVESGIHAREWITVATATYIIDAFINSDDKHVRALAESYDWYVVPSVNPDGYVYTHEKNRLWRKTRSPGNTFCNGVDANRNWDYEWRTVGASKNPCDETYAGKGPFSEIETKSLSAYLKSVSDKVFAYISFHSYSQLLLFPYGHTTKHLENYEELHAISAKTVAALSRRYGTKYVYGNIAETIYKASGSSIDYAKGALKIPLAFTYEFRDTGRHGFILPADQIIPNSEEILDSLVAMFSEAKRMGYPKP